MTLDRALCIGAGLCCGVIGGAMGACGIRLLSCGTDSYPQLYCAAFPDFLIGPTMLWGIIGTFAGIVSSYG